jgi:hypothetical protein
MNHHLEDADVKPVVTGAERLPLDARTVGVGMTRSVGRLGGAMPGYDRTRTEVFLLVAAGRSNREIAAACVVSEGTVKLHVSRMLAKVGLRDRIQTLVSPTRQASSSQAASHGCLPPSQQSGPVPRGPQ